MPEYFIRLKKTVVFIALFVATVSVSQSWALNAQIASSVQNITTFLGTANAKLVFRNADPTDSYLYFIDFSAATPAITKMNNTYMAIAPVISPDGQYVVFERGGSNDGTTQNPCTSFVCQLSADAQPVMVAAGNSYTPRFIYAAPAPTIMYATCASNPNDPVNGISAVWNGCGKVVKRTCQNLVVGPEQDVFTGGSYMGGLSFDGSFLATSNEGPNCFMLDLHNPASAPARLYRLDCISTTGGADTIVDLQTCNPSISSSRIFTSCMMFLDFGFYKPGYTTRAGSYWDMHDRIFICDIRNRLVKYFDVNDLPFAVKGSSAGPGGILNTQYDNPEWSNHPYYAAANILVDRIFKPATTWVHSQNHEAIYVIGLKDSSYLHLVQSGDTTVSTSKTDLRWPWLWINVPAGFETTEDPDWLNPDAPVVMPLRYRADGSNEIYLRNGTVTSASPITSLTVYNPAGRLIAHVEVNNTHSISLSPSWFPKSGIYFIHVRAADHAGRIFKITSLTSAESGQIRSVR
jgi:hypothetical protein